MEMYKLTSKTKLIFLILCTIILYNSNPLADEKKNLPDGSRLIGTMGLLTFVVVPESKKTSIEFHRQVISAVCTPKKTCFLRVYTNSKKAPEKIPLDDRILSEPTMMFQRSAKHRSEVTQWSCRLKMSLKSCF